MKTEPLLTLIKAALADIKAQDVVALAVTNMTSIADYIVIASGTSSRHVKSIADRVIEKVKEAGVKPLGVEGDAQADWVLVDIGDIVLHVMTPATRQLYDLERLWAPAPAVTMNASTANPADTPARKPAAGARKTAAPKAKAGDEPAPRKRAASKEASDAKPAARKPRTAGSATGRPAKPRAPRRKPVE